jgi:hypothetical protein
MKRRDRRGASRRAAISFYVKRAHQLRTEAYSGTMLELWARLMRIVRLAGMSVNDP